MSIIIRSKLLLAKHRIRLWRVQGRLSCHLQHPWRLGLNEGKSQKHSAKQNSSDVLMHPRIQNHVHQETYVWSLHKKFVDEPNPYKKLNIIISRFQNYKIISIKVKAIFRGDFATLDLTLTFWFFFDWIWRFSLGRSWKK